MGKAKIFIPPKMKRDNNSKSRYWHPGTPWHLKPMSGPAASTYVPKNKKVGNYYTP